MDNRARGYNITLQLHKNLKGHAYTYNSNSFFVSRVFNCHKIQLNFFLQGKEVLFCLYIYICVMKFGQKNNEINCIKMFQLIYIVCKESKQSISPQ